ncbi:FUSC family protein [Lysobacter korlensis]|uniref:FUSC family protein n=1 Tax=Lysobacter korlensis TaxID=553636 RepID=A0ABV6RV59_9GAMM
MAEASGPAKRRLERRIMRRLGLRSSLDRVWQSVPAAVQIGVAAVVAYAIGHYLAGHELPLIAVIVTITTLGFSRDARPGRVLETVIGILAGILLSALLVLVVGRGVWQLGLAILLGALVGRALSANPAVAVAAGVQAVLVVLLPDPAGGPFLRGIDGAIGGAVALLATALLPRDPRGAARRDGLALFAVLEEGTLSAAEALRRGEELAAEFALSRLRGTQRLVNDWTTSLESAVAISRISPFLRRRLPELRSQGRLLQAGDLAARNLRLIARRIEFLVRDEQPREALADALGETAAAIRELRDGVTNPSALAEARTRLERLAVRLDPASLTSGNVSDAALVLMIRPLVVDLLTGTGLDADSARALLPPL